MKLRVLDRLVAGLTGIILLTFGALGLYSLWYAEKWNVQKLEGTEWWIALAIFAVLILLGIYGLSVLFRRRRDKGFVIQRTEYGDMSISMKAMENMVRKCVDSHEELKVNNTSIFRVKDGVQVDVRITLPSGANIPLTVNALQRQIKQYITSCSGVDVVKVQVKVETDIARLAAPVPMPVLDTPQPSEEEKNETAAQEMMHHCEEPANYAETAQEAEPVVEDAQEAECAEAEADAEEPLSEEILSEELLTEADAPVQEEQPEETAGEAEEKAAEAAQTEGAQA